MSTVFFATVLITLLAFAFGVLVGHSATEQLLAQRSRRQAAIQADLDEQWHTLEASWELANRLFRESQSTPYAIHHRRLVTRTIRNDPYRAVQSDVRHL